MMPAMPTDGAWWTTHPIAHRGLHDDVRPENSRAAFDAAIAAGYPIELDVHLADDGTLRVFHDDTLVRMTGAPGHIATVLAEDLARLRLSGTDESIPTLPEVLAQIRDRVPVLVELKTGGRPDAIADAAARCVAEYRGAVALQSFDPRAVLRLRRRSRHAVLGILASDFTGEHVSRTEAFVLRRLLLAPAVRPDFIGYALPCLPYWATTVARRLGVPVVAWTIRTEAQLVRARAVADNCIFEGVRP